MFFSDLSFIFVWWLGLFLIGLVFLPITILVFPRFFDRGYIFSKVLGMLFLSYAIFLLGTFKILPFTFPTIVLALFVWGSISVLVLVKDQPLQRLILGRLPWKIFLFEEILFLAGLSLWSFIRAHEPSIHGLEKYMDFGFVNSVLRTEYFPAKDLWLTPLSINYYYFGHLVTAVLTKLSGIDPAVTYNLMIATLFAFTFTGAFSMGLNLYHRTAQNKTQNYADSLRPALICGLLAGFLLALAGNLHTIYAFFTGYNGENPVPFWTLALDFNLSDYWYPNATRFIPFTIHEFPLYSFVVSDLHGHVLSIPIVLTIIAILLNVYMSKRINYFSLVLISFLLACAYMTNAWDGLIYFILTTLVICYVGWKQLRTNKTLNTTNTTNFKYYKYFNIGGLVVLVCIGSILFSLPFSLFFKPFVAGIGIICAPEFLTNIGRLGPFLFEADHCQRSPLWQFIILHGFWYFWVTAFVVFLLKFRRRITNYQLPITDVFVLVLIGLSTILLFLPEFIYAKDIYPAHYRANTMFKLGYQAFMMLGISSAYIIVRLFLELKYSIINRKLLVVLVCIGSIGLFLVGIYPYFAINSYYGNLKIYRGLDGLVYLRDLYPTDYEAILWIRENIKGQPVILEGAGESYTDYARVSANTGLPTVVGWPVHEWLWRGTYDEAGKRVSEVEKMYTTTDISELRQLVEKYKVEYIFVGMLERQKYPNLNKENLKMFGEPIYTNGQTTVYEIRI